MPKLLEFLRGELRPVFDKLLLFIEQGAYDHVAARAMGVHPQTWSRWMGRGSQERKGIYREFYLEVSTARSKARLLKELEVARDDPKFWLRCGPGKTKPDDPGWTESLTLVGDPEAPIEVHVEHEGEQTEAERINDLATTLLLLQQHGFVSITEAGVQTVAAQPKQTGRPNLVVDEAKPAPVTPIKPVDEDEDDEDAGDEGDDKGYFPERPKIDTLADKQTRKLLPGQTVESILEPPADDEPPPPADYQ